MEREPEEVDFDAELFGGDLVVAMLKAHMLIERELTFMLEHLLPNPDAIRRRRWGYATRADLVEALGLLESHQIEACRFVGALRNKVSHQLDYEISDEDVEAFVSMLDPELREFVLRLAPVDLGLALATFVWRLREQRQIRTDAGVIRGSSRDIARFSPSSPWSASAGVEFADVERVDASKCRTSWRSVSIPR